MTMPLYETRTAYPTTCDQGPGLSVAAWARKLSPRRFFRVQRWRAELGGLTDVELKDIGLSRCQIDAVANETFSC